MTWCARCNIAEYLFSLGYTVTTIAGVVRLIQALLVLSRALKTGKLSFPEALKHLWLWGLIPEQTRGTSSLMGQAKPAAHDFKTCCHHSKDFISVVLLLDNVTNRNTDSLLDSFLSPSAGGRFSKVWWSQERRSTRLLCAKWFSDLGTSGFGLGKGMPTSGSALATSLLWVE